MNKYDLDNYFSFGTNAESTMGLDLNGCFIHDFIVFYFIAFADIVNKDSGLDYSFFMGIFQVFDSSYYRHF